MLAETAGETAHDFISITLTQLLQRMWEEICAYHCCQPEEGSSLKAVIKHFLDGVYTTLSSKCSPSLQRAVHSNSGNQKNIFSSSVILDFKQFLLLSVKLKFLKGFHKENTLSLASLIGFSLLYNLV